MITQDLFEHYVPAFAAPDSQTFDRLSGFLATAETEATERFGDSLPDDPLRRQWICLSAAGHAVPHLDLALTPTGFGVVSNTHTVPASPARVEALLKELRFRLTSVGDALTEKLTRTDWNTGPAAYRIFSVLLYCPTECRAYGVPCHSDEEYTALLPRLTEADRQIGDCISPELLGEVLTVMRTGRNCTPVWQSLIHRMKRTAAMIVRPEGRNEASVRRALQDLKRFVQQQAATDFPLYLTTATAAADRVQRERSPQNHPDAFFFG